MRIIIDNRTELTDAEALKRVLSVVEYGLVSKDKHGAHYCYITEFTDHVFVDVERRKTGYRFLLCHNANEQ